MTEVALGKGEHFLRMEGEHQDLPISLGAVFARFLAPPSVALGAPGLRETLQLHRVRDPGRTTLDDQVHSSVPSIAAGHQNDLLVGPQIGCLLLAFTRAEVQRVVNPRQPVASYEVGRPLGRSRPRTAPPTRATSERHPSSSRLQQTRCTSRAGMLSGLSPVCPTSLTALPREMHAIASAVQSDRNVGFGGVGDVPVQHRSHLLRRRWHRRDRLATWWMGPASRDHFCSPSGECVRLPRGAEL
jgi:hypothetical protein